MTEVHAIYLLLALAVLAAGLIVWHYGKPEPIAHVAEVSKRFHVYADTGAHMLATDNASDAAKSAAWHNGRIEDIWEQ